MNKIYKFNVNSKRCESTMQKKKDNQDSILLTL